MNLNEPVIEINFNSSTYSYKQNNRYVQTTKYLINKRRFFYADNMKCFRLNKKENFKSSNGQVEII